MPQLEVIVELRVMTCTDLCIIFMCVYVCVLYASVHLVFWKESNVRNLVKLRMIKGFWYAVTKLYVVLCVF